MRRSYPGAFTPSSSSHTGPRAPPSPPEAPSNHHRYPEWIDPVSLDLMAAVTAHDLALGVLRTNKARIPSVLWR